MEDKKQLEYAKPEIRDLGELKELTAVTTNKGLTDVPKGTPGPTGAFSP
jgi:hypothetical protein